MALVCPVSELQEDTLHKVYKNVQACFLLSEILKGKGSLGRRQAVRAETDDTICITRQRKGVSVNGPLVCGYPGSSQRLR